MNGPDWVTHISCLVLGIVSLTLSLIISVSQITSLIKTKNTSGVSISTYIIFVVAGAMCLTWGFSYYFQEMQIKEIPDQKGIPYLLYQWEMIPIICYYITDFCLSNTMVFIKARHMSLAKKLGMNELELAEYLKDRQNKKYIKSGKKFSASENFPVFLVLFVLFSIVVTFAICFTLFATPEPIYDWHKVDGKWVCDWDGYKWVVPSSLLAALLWEAISWPQFIKSLRQKDTSGISMNWAIFMPVALTVSFTYALVLALKMGDFEYDTIGALVFNGMIVNYGILIIKCINRKKAKKLGLNELQYTKKYLIPAWKKKEAAKAAKKAAQAK